MPIETKITVRKAITNSVRVLNGIKNELMPKIMSGNAKKMIMTLEPYAFNLYQFSSELNDLGIRTPYNSFMGILPCIKGTDIPITSNPTKMLTMPMNGRNVVTTSNGVELGIQVYIFVR
jgi:hypothetical protein